jgi:hypothetical protein
LASVAGLVPPLAVRAFDPVKNPPESLAFHDAAVPMPRTWPSSCVATLRKSFCPDVGLVELKFQFAVELKVIDPPHGPKSVAGVASAPACPRALTVLSHACDPLALKPPGPPCPSSTPDRSLRPPT